MVSVPRRSRCMALTSVPTVRKLSLFSTARSRSLKKDCCSKSFITVRSAVRSNTAFASRNRALDIS